MLQALIRRWRLTLVAALARIVSAQAPSGTTRGRRRSTPTPSAIRRGQSVQPVFEGWSSNPDGSFAMWFGYLESQLRGAAQRRRRRRQRLQRRGHGPAGVLRDAAPAVRVQGRSCPATFPKDRDLVWTLKANGVTLKAYGCLWPVWEIDQNTISANRGSRTAVDFDEPPNEAPRVVDPPPPQTVEVGKPLAAVAVGRRRWQSEAADRSRRARGGDQEPGDGRELPLNQSLRVSWLQWRGPGVATFDPKVGARRRRQGGDEGGVRQARTLRAARLRRGREHPHAARRAGDRRSLVDNSVGRAGARQRHGGLSPALAFVEDARSLQLPCPPRGPRPSGRRSGAV